MESPFCVKLRLDLPRIFVRHGIMSKRGGPTLDKLEPKKLYWQNFLPYRQEKYGVGTIDAIIVKEGVLHFKMHNCYIQCNTGRISDLGLMVVHH